MEAARANFEAALLAHAADGAHDSCTRQVELGQGSVLHNACLHLCSGMLQSLRARRFDDADQLPQPASVDLPAAGTHAEAGEELYDLGLFQGCCAILPGSPTQGSIVTVAISEQRPQQSKCEVDTIQRNFLRRAGKVREPPQQQHRRKEARCARCVRTVSQTIGSLAVALEALHIACCFHDLKCGRHRGIVSRDQIQPVGQLETAP
mmetsp:Transcript_82404/g.236771  ORF Transcript_82404/g.236771 Transcript_82404/m.236771 type:complete len:206 (-) Transcript_82404:9-626(-)